MKSLDQKTKEETNVKKDSSCNISLAQISNLEEKNASHSKQAMSDKPETKSGTQFTLDKEKISTAVISKLKSGKAKRQTNLKKTRKRKHENINAEK